MSFNIGVLNAAVALDKSEWKSGLSSMPGEAEGVFKQVAGYAAAYLSARALFGFAAEAADAFAQSQDAVEGLRSSLRNVGADADALMPKLQRLASDLQNRTKNEDDATKVVMSQGINLGIKPDEIEAVTEAAVGLAAKLRIDLATAMDLLAKANAGRTEMLSRYGIVLDETLSKEEKFAALLKMGKNSMQLAEDQVKTYAGAVAQMKNDVGDSMEIIGERVAGKLTPGVKGVRELALEFNSLPASMQDSIMTITAMSAGVLLLQTNAAKLANTKIMSFVSGGGGIQAKAEAAVVEAAESQKRASYTATATMRAAHDQVAAARIARMNVAEAQAAVNAAQINLKNAVGVEAVTVAKRDLLTATMALNKAQATEAATTGAISGKRLAAQVAIRQQTAATAQLAAAQTVANTAQTAGGRAALILGGGLNAAATSVRAFFASLGPIGWAMIAIAGIAAAVNWVKSEAEAAANVATEAAQKAHDASAENDTYNRKQLSGMSRIQELAGYEKLNNSEREEAKRILRELGIAYDDNAESVGAMVSRMGDEKKSLKELIDLRKEQLKLDRIKKLEDEVAKNNAAIEANDAKRGGAGRAFWSAAPGKNTEVDEYSTLFGIDSIAKVDRPINEANAALRKKNAAILSEIMGLKTGTDLTKPTTEKQAEESDAIRRAQESLKNARFQADFNSADAAKQEKLLTDQIAETRKKLFDSAGNKKESDYTAKELEMAKQLVDLEAKRAELKKRAADYLKDETEASRKSEEARQKSQAQRELDRQFGKLERDGDIAGYDNLLESEIKKAKEAAAKLKRDYEKSLADSQGDGIITDEERKRNDEARRKFEEEQARADALAEKKLDREAEGDRTQKKSIGSFSSEVVAAMLGSGKPAEETAKNTKEITKLCRELVAGQSNGEELGD